ncbi:integrase [Escherichia coli]|nr:integrase [Escherichia coli]EFE3691613.1 integrase [Escherichia coli]EFE7999380.1 integrase [Escherichia coli]EFI4079565.1 integrase [Escherichia coli]EFN8796837.1 integrase [Escherichia coli]
MVVTTSDVVMCQMRHSDVQGVYRVYGSWMAENVQDQVSILNQKMSEFTPSMPHALRLEVINNRLQNLHLHAHHFLIRRHQLITHLNPHLH